MRWCSCIILSYKRDRSGDQDQRGRKGPRSIQEGFDGCANGISALGLGRAISFATPQKQGGYDNFQQDERGPMHQPSTAGRLLSDTSGKSPRTGRIRMPPAWTGYVNILLPLAFQTVVAARPFFGGAMRAPQLAPFQPTTRSCFPRVEKKVTDSKFQRMCTGLALFLCQSWARHKDGLTAKF